MENYTVLGRIGEGAHGVVVKARHLQTGQTVALKKVPLKRLDQGIPLSALREIKALQHIHYKNVLTLLDVFAEGAGFVLVFELMLGDLAEIIRDTSRNLTSGQEKSYMKMILSGVQFLHQNNIMHRGDSDIDQLRVVLQTMGTPNEKVWPGLQDIPDYKKITFPEYEPVPLERVMPEAPEKALDLIKKFLVYYPGDRIRACNALQHEYFYSYPLAAPLEKMPVPPIEKNRRHLNPEYNSNITVADLLSEGKSLLKSLMEPGLGT